MSRQATPICVVTCPGSADGVTDGGQPDKVVANAPDPQDGFFTVPKVVE